MEETKDGRSASDHAGAPLRVSFQDSSEFPRQKYVKIWDDRAHLFLHIRHRHFCSSFRKQVIKISRVLVVITPSAG